LLLVDDISDKMADQENFSHRGVIKSYNIKGGFGFFHGVPGINADVRFNREDLPGQFHNQFELKVRWSLAHWFVALRLRLKKVFTK
jgi:hypothetical protein